MHVFIRPQVYDPLIAINEDRIAVERLSGDVLCVNDKRDRPCAGHNGRVRPDRAFFKNDTAQTLAVFQQFAWSDVARHENGVLWHRGAGLFALTRQDAKKTVRQIVEVVQTVAQIGVTRAVHAAAGEGLFFLYGSFGGQAALHVFFHAAHPAARICKHAIRFEHLNLFGVHSRCRVQHVIDRNTQRINGFAQACQFAVGVIGDRVRHNNARFVQVNVAVGCAFLTRGATEQNGLLVTGSHGRTFAHKCAQLCHFGENHCDNFKRVNLVCGKFASFSGLHDQNAQGAAKSLDRHTAEGRISFFARFRHIAEPFGGGRVGGVDYAAGASNAAHQTFAQTHPCLVHSGRVQTFGRAKFERFRITE